LVSTYTVIYFSKIKIEQNVNVKMCLFLYICVTDPGDRRFVGMWWGGFFLCGVLLIVLAGPFFLFPKTMKREKQRIRIQEKSKPGALTSGISTAAVDQEKAAITNAPSTSPPSTSQRCKQNKEHKSCCSKVMGN
jgi:hypothetical protein